MGTDVLQNLHHDDGEENLREFIYGRTVFQRAFAEGRVFTPEIYGSLLGRVYHVPATLELVHCFCSDYEVGASRPWQVSCPDEWTNKEFGELVMAWMNGKWKDLKPRRGGLVGREWRNPERGTQDIALVLGLYRGTSKQADRVTNPISCETLDSRCSYDTSHFEVEPVAAAPEGMAGYHVTMPRKHWLLRHDDYILVFGDEAFGTHMLACGLLQGPLDHEMERKSKWLNPSSSANAGSAMGQDAPQGPQTATVDDCLPTSLREDSNEQFFGL